MQRSFSNQEVSKVSTIEVQRSDETTCDKVLQEVSKILARYLEGALLSSEACMLLMIGINEYKNEIIQEFDVIGKDTE